MDKSELIAIRITPQQKEKLKDLKVSYAECFKIGYEKTMENYRQELEKLDKKYYDLYIHVHTKLETFDQKKTEIEQNKTEKVVKSILTEFNPEYYVGKTINGIEITKKLLVKYQKDGE